MKNINDLFKKLDNLPYPDTMIKVKGEIPGLAFFPGGKGTYDNADTLINKDIMILGQDFDCETNHASSLEKGAEDPAKNPTWRNLLKLLDEAGISPNQCFFTNAIMGVRKGNNGVGKSPAFNDSKFISACQEFFLSQIELQKPKAIFVLGGFVSEFLAATSKDLEVWTKFKNFDRLDSFGNQIKKNVVFNNDIKSNVAVLMHPSFRPVNIARRKFQKYQGNKAEIMMIKDVLES